MITIDPIKRPPKKSSSVDTTEIMKEVDLKFADFIGGAPEKLDTIKELADAIENLPNLDNFITNETLNKLLSISKYEFVDLGLPSGLKWASCNVGATKPEEYGLYFAWGETQGYTGITDDKKFTWSEYEFSIDGSGTNFSKYNSNDKLKELETSDDAASATQSTCRMPTSGECQELIDNTTSAWTTDYNGSGVSGVIFTSTKEGYTDKSIFLPASGYCGNGSLYRASSDGFYWSSSLYESDSRSSWFLYFNSGDVDVRVIDRFCGQCVRAVQDANIVNNKFNPTNYYTKSEIDNMIISTLNTEV